LPALGRSRDRFRHTERIEKGEEIVKARLLGWQPLGKRGRFALPARRAKILQREIQTERATQDVFPIHSGPPDQIEIEILGNGTAALNRGSLPGNLIKGFRIQHEPVHIEDDCADRQS
jgi:hypothetical protein